MDLWPDCGLSLLQVERLSSELNQAWTGKGGGATGQAGASGGGGGGGFNSQNRDLVSMALGANGSASAIRAEADSRFKEVSRRRGGAAAEVVEGERVWPTGGWRSRH